MNNIPAQAAMGWDSPKRRSRSHGRTRLRDVVPAIAAVVLLAISHLLYGASQPVAALTMSGAFIIVALVVVLFAGPRHVTMGMIVGAAVLAIYAAFGLAGPMDRAAPDLAVLFAAGALWIIGFIAARRRGALDAAWAGLIWGSVAYCVWMFSIDVAASMATPGGGALAASFATPGAGSTLFGLFAILGLGRVLHVIKQMDAEALARSQMIERVLRDGLSGLLLLGFAITCLLIIGSRAGMVMTAGVMLIYAWWDTLSITTREHRGLLMRFLALVAPVAAAALMAWGVSLAWLSDETIAPGIGLADQLPNMQRIQAYMASWAQAPAMGHGLGSTGPIGAQATTLFNAKAMLAPGDAHNVFVTWLVETGVVGLSLLVLALTAMHARILGALRSRKTPRTFLRMAVMAGLLMLLHGVSDFSLELPSATWLYALLLGAACGVATGRRIDPAADAEDEEMGE